MNGAPSPRHLLVGGLGAPHDQFAAAAIANTSRRATSAGTSVGTSVSTSVSHSVSTWGPFDGPAFERGRAILPRGQCAPILYTTGGLLKKAKTIDEPLSLLSVRSCGPCRYALFEPAWTRALAEAGHHDVRIVAAEQSVEGLRGLVGAAGMPTLLDALLVADVHREVVHRLRPRVEDIPDLEASAAAAARRMAAAIESGISPVDALSREAGFHRHLRRRPPTPLARVLLLGDPWSLHVQGDGQLNLPRVLAGAGAEVEIPPFALWLDYVLWQMRAAPFGRAAPPTPARVALSLRLAEQLRERLRSAARAGGLGGFELPQMDELAELAEPHLSPGVRGGYGHIEVGLAVRARRERRAHLAISVKSFGCIPSSGVSDAIVPTALAGTIPFLALEVSGDGEAARESRLMLRVASAVDAAAADLLNALGQHQDTPDAPDPLAASDSRVPPFDALDGAFESGPRTHACTLACHVYHAASAALVAPAHP